MPGTRPPGGIRAVFASSRYTMPAVVFAALCAAPLVANGYYLFIFSMAAAYIVGALGFDMALGQAGLLAFIGSAFFGIGALVSGRLAQWGWPAELTIVAAVVAGLIVAIIYGLVTVRLQAYYFAITGIVLMLLLDYFYRNADSMTGGYSGFSIPAPKFLLAGNSPIVSTQALFYVGVVLMLIAFVIASAIHRSRIGRAWRVIRESSAVAEGLGIDVRRSKLNAIVISAGFLSAGGAWFGYLSMRFLPESYLFNQLLLLFLMIIIGGLRSPLGVVIGGMILIWLNQYLASFVGLSEIIYGLGLLVCVLLFSKGIYGTLQHRFGWFREGVV